MISQKDITFEVIVEFFKDELGQVEDSIKENFLTDVSLIPTISKYLNNNGGKRIRPLLLLLSSKLSGYNFNNGNRHITYSCVVEFIHLATLLHDDVLDDAQIRRGKESANVKWGNKASVLVADYLFAKSYVLLGDEDNKKILNFMTRTTQKMVEGETLQLMNTYKLNTTEEQYLDAVYRKTAVLFSSSCRIGSVIGGGTKEEEDALDVFGANIGYAFQLIDDVLDYFADKAKFGKQPGIDLYDGKITLPLIHLYKNADYVEKSKIEDIIDSKAATESDFKYVVLLMKKYESREYALSMARRYIEEAKEKVSCFDESKYFHALISLADYVIERNL